VFAVLEANVAEPAGGRCGVFVHDVHVQRLFCCTLFDLRLCFDFVKVCGAQRVSPKDVCGEAVLGVRWQPRQRVAVAGISSPYAIFNTEDLAFLRRWASVNGFDLICEVVWEQISRSDLTLQYFRTPVSYRHAHPSVAASKLPLCVRRILRLRVGWRFCVQQPEYWRWCTKRVHKVGSTWSSFR
jgi:hypothetical protein